MAKPPFWHKKEEEHTQAAFATRLEARIVLEGVAEVVLRRREELSRHLPDLHLLPSSRSMAGHTWLVAASMLLSMLITGLDAQANNCVWTPYPRTLIYGGTPVSSANTLGACQMACVGSCTGVDWAPNNAAGSQCFLLQKKTDKVSNVDGVDHYDYDCPGSGSGGCSFSQPIPNTNIYGGAANPASTLQACMAACQLNTSCQGIDWAPGNSAGQQCFLQSTTSGKNSGITGVTHYDYFCNGTAGGTTLVPPPPPPSNVCQFAAAAVTDTSSVGGYNAPEIPVAFCSVTCYAISACLGYDVGPTTGCWFHFNATAYGRKYYQQYVTQIDIRRCPEQNIDSCTAAYNNGVLTDACVSVCIPKFTTWQNTAGSGGMVVNTAGFRNASSCLEYCFLQSPSCVGVDYSEQPGSASVCTIYTQLSPSNNVVKAFVTQYRLESRCSQNCSTNWEYNDNIRYRLYMPTVVSNIFTQADCLRTCRVSPTCEIYQFTKSGPGAPSCSIANSFFEGSGVNDSTVTTGIYRRLCVNLSPLPPTPPGSGSGGGCSFSQPIPNTNIYGGAANPAATLQACMAACQLNTSCQGIDWAPGNSAGQQCFLQSTTSGKNSGITGVTHYDYFCNGSGNAGGGTTLPGSLLSSTTIVPTNCWDVYNNTLIYGGTQNPATSLNDCYTACRTLGRPSCLSVDWSRVNAVGSQCFILNTQMGKVQTQGVDHYDLKSNC